MARPKPWSFSSLDTFKTCPRKYYGEYVLKIDKGPESPEQAYGTRVHKIFEDNQVSGKPLTPDLKAHQDYMDELRALPGKVYGERKVGLTAKLEPCDFFAPDVWWRGVIDWSKEIEPGKVKVVDYKTGKVKPKPLQLHLFSLYYFLEGAKWVESNYYWTQTKESTKFTLPRQQINPILMSVTPDLQQYKQAFKEDIWQPRPSGLCKHYCGVVDCEFHGVGARGR